MAEKQRPIVMDNDLYNKTIEYFGSEDVVKGGEALLVALATTQFAIVTYMKTFLTDREIKGQISDWTKDCINRINRSKH